MHVKDLTTRFKLDIVTRRISGCPIETLAQRYEVSYDTMYRWVHSDWYGRILQEIINLVKTQPVEHWEI